MRFFLLVLLSLLCGRTSAQLLKGRVMDAATDSALTGATIFNLSQHVYNKAGVHGQYSIIARPTDTVIFSSIGYTSDTVSITGELLGQSLDIGLKNAPGTLKTVYIDRSYAADSLARRQEYRWLYDAPSTTATSTHDANDGFGLRLSPITYWSKEKRSERRLKKQLAVQEQQAYVDYRFSKRYVEHLTGLSGDSLQTFMVRYRPPYELVRRASAEDLFRYTNDALIRFHKGQK